MRDVKQKPKTAIGTKLICIYLTFTDLIVKVKQYLVLSYFINLISERNTLCDTTLYMLISALNYVNLIAYHVMHSLSIEFYRFSKCNMESVSYSNIAISCTKYVCYVL